MWIPVIAELNQASFASDLFLKLSASYQISNLCYRQSVNAYRNLDDLTGNMFMLTKTINVSI